MAGLRVAIAAFNDIRPFHLSIPCAVFGEAAGAKEPLFNLRVCAVEPGELHSQIGFTIGTPYGLKDLLQAKVVVVPSWRDPREPAPAPLLAALRQVHKRGGLLVGLCLGAFVLAEAGLLDGRRATTHWRWTKLFAQRFPKVQVDPNVLYVDQGNVITSAGTAAGIDCCLHVVRKHYGAEATNRIARILVVPPHRQGSQAQYIEQPVMATINDTPLTRTLNWAARHLDEPHSLDSLAARALMSRRTFTRHFHKLTGTTVAKWLLGQRLTLAQRLLETSSKSVDLIATRAGFGSAASMRKHFGSALHTSPSVYRREFRSVG